ncbi:hypothetical protein [Actinospica durhamensis]|uniref:hypothetical protein n=1 Tax=Actinospica durhamensis TaxID=1508375 RepID=UPI0034D395FE
MQAQNLKPGDLLQSPAGPAQITGIRLFHADGTTYDLTIGALHTFYVVAGSTPVLVHNCDLALGWRTKGTSKWASDNGFKDYINAPNDGWRTPVERQIGDPNVKLHVNMTGWTTDFEGAVRNGLTEAGGLATETEMGWIARAVSKGQRTWDSVNFYRADANGDIVPIVRPTEPVWSDFGKLAPVDSKFTMCMCDGAVDWGE